MSLLRTCIAGLAIALSACAPTLEQTDSTAAPTVAQAEVQPFVIAANPLAAQAGMDVLERGGRALGASQL